jgi:hypothetical protein
MSHSFKIAVDALIRRLDSRTEIFYAKAKEVEDSLTEIPETKEPFKSLKHIVDTDNTPHIIVDRQYQYGYNDDGVFVCIGRQDRVYPNHITHNPITIPKKRYLAQIFREDYLYYTLLIHR